MAQATSSPRANEADKPPPGHALPGQGADDLPLAAVEARMRALVRGKTGAAGATPDLLVSIGLAHLESGGKRLRARLALSAAAALGVPQEAALPWATACELAHNATLIHDDLQDGDEVRRGRPATWVTYGAAQAINAGDLFLMLPLLALEEVPAPCRAALLSALGRGLVAVIRGQARECSQVGQGPADWPTYLDTVAGKTSALFALPVEGAALLAGHAPSAAQALARPFARLGTAFQIQDDLVDLLGDKGRRRAGNDLREGKISALVVEHLARRPADAPWLWALLKRPWAETSDAEVTEAKARFLAAGTVAGSVRVLNAEAAAARAEVAPALASQLEDLLDRILRPVAHLGPT